ncbi:DUF4381 domain-containing protein [Microbulbifer sp. ALW1]|uniref:DUF4381 domain-containing protein n=1 Tax=Microbulbifer sp. (strain ALW1) TaxID=1516059 RepID=UPI00135AC7B7|nr:DUF4381 domain-containing protein [Microbulbifer sp. ALW1]
MQETKPTPIRNPDPQPQNTNPAADEETLPDMIAQLVPPPEPPAISMLPATPLAKGLCALVVLLLLWFIWRCIQSYRANAYRRAALAELHQAESDAALIAEILRRTALAAYPRVKVAALIGDDWLQFLNAHYPGNAFDGDLGHALLQSPYRTTTTEQTAALSQAVQDWIRQHKVVAPSRHRLGSPRKTVEAAP